MTKIQYSGETPAYSEAVYGQSNVCEWVDRIDLHDWDEKDQEKLGGQIRCAPWFWIAPHSECSARIKE